MSQRLFLISFITAFLLIAGNVVLAENIDPFNLDFQHAYGENVGWFNAEPSGDGGPGVEVGDTELTGYIWAENIGWVSLSCENTTSCGTVSYGVTNDGTGRLSGYAWSENAGWISFSCKNTDSCGSVNYGVAIDPASGEFDGNAWGENIGWINFGPGYGGLKTSWVGAMLDPVPDIRANDSDGPMTISSSTNLSVSVELDAGGAVGVNADWWVLAKTSRGKWFYYSHALGDWFPGQIVTHQGPLFDLSYYEVLNRTGLPPTTYIFHFGVDTDMNGVIDMGSMIYDSVTVTVQP